MMKPFPDPSMAHFYNYFKSGKKADDTSSTGKKGLSTKKDIYDHLQSVKAKLESHSKNGEPLPWKKKEIARYVKSVTEQLMHCPDEPKDPIPKVIEQRTPAHKRVASEKKKTRSAKIEKTSSSTHSERSTPSAALTEASDATSARDPPPPTPVEIVANSSSRSWLASKSTKSTAESSSTKSRAKEVTNSLQSYTDMIVKVEKPIESIRDQLFKDTNLTETEKIAYWEGYSIIHSLEKKEKKEVSVPLRSAKEPEAQLSAARKYPSMKMPDPPPQRSWLAQLAGTGMDVSRTSFDDDNTISSVYSTLSCRELSIQRIKRNKVESKAKVHTLLQELKQAEDRQKKLEKQLEQAGVEIAEDIPYEVAKAQVNRISRRMQEIGTSQATHDDPETQKMLRQEYFVLEQDMEKYSKALMLTDEYIQEQQSAEEAWEREVEADNKVALQKLWRHIPVNVRKMSLQEMMNSSTPNGRYLSNKLAKKFRRTDILQLLRVDPNQIARSHPTNLENLKVTGLTVTERRALHAHLRPVSLQWKRKDKDPLTQRKLEWYNMIRSNFKENLMRYQHRVAQYGEGSEHSCPMIANMCPVKADMAMDYSGDYGFPASLDHPQYEQSTLHGKANINDQGARAQLEALELAKNKAENDRNNVLKRHYKGKLLEAALAGGSCDAMLELMGKLESYQQKWLTDRHYSEAPPTPQAELANFEEALNHLRLAILPIAERCGMQTAGAKKEGSGNYDTRSTLEIGLCEDVYETAIDFLKSIKTRSRELEAEDKILRSMVRKLEPFLDDIHQINETTLQTLGQNRPPRSSGYKTEQMILADLRKKKEDKKEVVPIDLTDVEEEPTRRHTAFPVMEGLSDNSTRKGLMAALASIHLKY